MLLFLNLVYGLTIEMSIPRSALLHHQEGFLKDSNLWTLKMVSYNLFEFESAFIPYEFTVKEINSKLITLRVFVTDIKRYNDPNIFFSILLFPKYEPQSIYKSSPYQLKSFDKGDHCLYKASPYVIVTLVQINFLYKNLVTIKDKQFPKADYSKRKDNIKLHDKKNDLFEYYQAVMDFKKDYFAFILAVLDYLDVEYTEAERKHLSSHVFNEGEFNLLNLNKGLIDKFSEASLEVCELVESHELINNKILELVDEKYLTNLNLCQCSII